MTKYVCSACSTTFTAAAATKPPRCRKCGSRDTSPLGVPVATEEIAELPDDVEEIGSADALTEEVDSTGLKNATARAERPTARRPGRRGSPPPAKAKKPPVAAFVGIGATLIGVVAVFIATSGNSKRDDSSDSKPADSTSSASSTASTESLPANPTDELAMRRSQLEPSDLAGRKTLIEFAKQHELNDVRLALLREVLLLDSEDAEARRALGFTKHETAGSPFYGRWLTKSDSELATDYDKLMGKGAP